MLYDVYELSCIYLPSLSLLAMTSCLYQKIPVATSNEHSWLHFWASRNNFRVRGAIHPVREREPRHDTRMVSLTCYWSVTRSSCLHGY
jgi:hypothetical protein